MMYDVYGKTYTDYAFENFDSLLATKLFRNGYDVTQPVKYLDKTIFNIQDSYGDTFLHYFFKTEQWEIIGFLMDNGADGSIKNDKGISFYDLVVEMEKH